MPADARRVKELFVAASELTDADARRIFLDRECAGDADLRRRLDALLQADDQPEPALEKPLAGDAELLTGAYEPRSEIPGAIVAGKYKLLESIGEGGMGEVWVADQLEPIKRRVAIKVIKAGMDSRSVLARFEAERQALALMDHPNIARVLDAGTTADGRPYFVMELVKGTPITQFCDTRKLSPRERLELFVPVCQAIQHAHTKGIIHRDIKPSNVLVALHDERPVPKVIDFGVAKAIGQQLTEKTIYTGFGALVGTPAYMAPEQATFNQLDVDTRADVYALGVLLYELLAGSPPFEPERLRQAAFDEILRMVREEEPPRPSARLSTSQARASIAAVRQTDPDKLTKLMRGELDWIVMKALEKDRNRRYGTATNLAEDILRYLRHETILARPPSTGYRLRKLFQRNRAAVLTATTIVFLLVAGTSIATWQAIRAARAERDANEKRDAAIAAELDAGTQRDEAKAARADADRRRYAIQMTAIQLAWENGRVRRVRELLEQSKPEQTGGVDLRGFEWYYWDRLCKRGSLLMLEGHSAIAYSTDGQRLAYVTGGRAFDNDGKPTTAQEVRICDAHTGRTLQSLPVRDGVNSLEFSPDGVLLACACRDRADYEDSSEKPNFVHIWNLKTGTIIRSIRHEKAARRTVFSPDGKTLATVSDAKVFLWDLEKKSDGRLLNTGSDGIQFAAFDPGGTEIEVISGPDRSWHNVETGALSRRDQSPLQFASQIASDSNRWIYAFNRVDRGLSLKFAHGDEELTLGAKPRVIAVSQSGGLVAGGFEDGTIRVWDKGGNLLDSHRGHERQVSRITFSSDDVRFASTDGQDVRVWQAGNKWAPRIIDPSRPEYFRGHPASVHPDGKHVALITDDNHVRDNHVRIADIATGRIVWWSPTFKSSPGPICMSPQGTRIAIMAYGREGNSPVEERVRKPAEVSVYDFITFREVFRATTVISDSNTANVAFSPDGKMLAALVGGRDSPMGIAHEIRLWDLETGKERTVAKGLKLEEIGWNWPMHFTPDGRNLSVATEDAIRFWDVGSGNELPQPTEKMTATKHAFSTDGRWIALVEHDRVKLIERSTGATNSTRIKHDDGIAELIFSPDSRRLVTVGEDHVARVWDPVTGDELLSLKEISGYVSFRGNGNVLFAESRDKEFRVFDGRPVSGQDAETVDKLVFLEERAAAQIYGWKRRVGNLEEIIAYRVATAGADDSGTISAKLELADLLTRINIWPEGNYRRAEQLYQEVIAVFAARLGQDDRYTLNVKERLASCAVEYGKLSIAETQLKDSLSGRINRLGANHELTFRTQVLLSRVYFLQGRTELAEAILNDARNNLKSSAERDAELLIAIDKRLANLYIRQRRYELAEPLLKERATICATEKNNYNLREYESDLAELYELWHKPELAHPLLKRQVEWARKEQCIFTDEAPRLIVASVQLGRNAEAAQLVRELTTYLKQKYAGTPLTAADELRKHGWALVRRKCWNVAEPILRECLSIYENEAADRWEVYHAKSILGQVLLEQRKFADAESLLLAAREGLRRHESDIPRNSWSMRILREPVVTELETSEEDIRLTVLGQAVDGIVRVYELTSKPEKAMEWRAKRPPQPGPKPRIVE